MSYEPTLLIDREGDVFSSAMKEFRVYTGQYCIHYKDNLYVSFGANVIDVLRVDSLDPLEISEYVGELADRSSDDYDRWHPDTDKFELVELLLHNDTSLSFVESRIETIRSTLSHYRSQIYIYSPPEEYRALVTFLKLNGFLDSDSNLRLM